MLTMLGYKYDTSSCVLCLQWCIVAGFKKEIEKLPTQQYFYIKTARHRYEMGHMVDHRDFR